MRPPCPGIKRALTGLLLLVPLTAARVAHAGSGQVRTAADVTQEWRGLPRLLERVLPAAETASDAPRTVILLIEPTPALAAIGLDAALDAYFERTPGLFARLRIGVARVGADKLVLQPSEEPRAVVEGVRQALKDPDARILNVYADLRTLAGTLATRAGDRGILLCALENGDAEDDLEATIARLKGSKVRVDVLTNESYVADSYWAERPWQEKPHGTQLTGGDSARIDLPFGWLFQLAVANEITPSGFASYGLSRLAAECGGTVHLHSAPSATVHTCAIYGICGFCSGNHAPEDEVFHSGRLRLVAPSLGTRVEVSAALAADPCARATANAWRAALAAGLVRGELPRPGRETGVDSAATGRASQLLTGNPERNAARARDAIQEVDQILAAFDAEWQRIEPTEGEPRQRAIGEFTRLMLLITRVNLITYAGFCREIAPRWLEKDQDRLDPPEVSVVDGSARGMQIGHHDICLCHGALPFLELELPGGKELRDALVQLDSEMKTFLRTFANTPYAIALHRQGIAIFQPSFSGTGPERARPKSKSGVAPGVPTGARPQRGGSGSGGAKGPTTGGGK